MGKSAGKGAKKAGKAAGKGAKKAGKAASKAGKKAGKGASMAAKRGMEFGGAGLVAGKKAWASGKSSFEVGACKELTLPPASRGLRNAGLPGVIRAEQHGLRRLQGESRRHLRY